jgi:hypothetical protein
VKKIFKFLAVVACALQTLSLPAQILESFTLHDVLDHLEDQTLVVLDIDNTLIEPKQQVGSDQWFCYMLKYHRSQGLNDVEALKEVLPLWTKIQLKTEVRTCEPATAFVVRKLQEKNVPVIGLTSRSVALAFRTIDQLDSVGVHLKRSAPHAQDFRLSTEFAAHEDPAYYIEGILFCSGGHKGDLLLDFLEHADYNPSKIIFVNDKEKYLVDVEETMEKQVRISYVGLRYGACDERVKNFDPTLAQLQLQCMKSLLSDEMASAILAKNDLNVQNNSAVCSDEPQGPQQLITKRKVKQ